MVHRAFFPGESLTEADGVKKLNSAHTDLHTGSPGAPAAWTGL
jgi:hypothetical protein